MTKEFSWTRNDPKTAVWNDSLDRQPEGYENVPMAWAESLPAHSLISALPEPALTVHVGGKAAEDVDDLLIGSVSYIHESNCIVLSVGSPSA